MHVFSNIKAFPANAWKNRRLNETTYSALSKSEGSTEDLETMSLPPMDERSLRRRQWGAFVWTCLWRTFAVLSLIALGTYVYDRYSIATNLPRFYGIYPSYIQHPPNYLVEWNGDDRFARGNRDQQSAWDDILPKGLGHVMLSVDEIKRLGLGEGKLLPGHDGEYGFAVSGFHQMHCLGMLREAFYRLRDGRPIDVDGHKHGPQFNITAHMDHCFDYLRQALMCYADPTIESVHRHGSEQNGPKPQDEGWGNTHVCRSWDALKDFVETRRPSDFKGLCVDHYFPEGHERRDGHSSCGQH